MSYLNCWTCKWNWLRFQLTTFLSQEKGKRFCRNITSLKIVHLRTRVSEKRKRTWQCCSENALEKKRWLSNRAANETFATSVRRTLRSSRSRQFLQAGPTTNQGIVLDVGKTARRTAVYLPACLLASRRCTFTSLLVLHGCPCARGHNYEQYGLV